MTRIGWTHFTAAAAVTVDSAITLGVAWPTLFGVVVCAFILFCEALGK